MTVADVNCSEVISGSSPWEGYRIHPIGSPLNPRDGGAGRRHPQHPTLTAIFTTLLDTIIAPVSTIFVSVTALLMTIAPDLTSFFPMTYPALSVPDSKAALIKAWTIPAVQIEASGNVFDQVQFVEGGSIDRHCRR
jgi:hypothetical protein